MYKVNVSRPSILSVSVGASRFLSFLSNYRLLLSHFLPLCSTQSAEIINVGFENASNNVISVKFDNSTTDRVWGVAWILLNPKCGFIRRKRPIASTVEDPRGVENIFKSSARVFMLPSIGTDPPVGRREFDGELSGKGGESHFPRYV